MNSTRSDGFKSKKKRMIFLLLKKEKQLELWINSDTGTALIQKYNITIHHNQLGPKVSNNSSNFPEGIYSVTDFGQKSLNIHFPNEFDKSKAKADNRTLKKENIMFGKSLNNNGFSLKETALTAIYQLIKTENIHDIQLISAPIDFRKNTFLPYCNHCPHWVNELYGQLKLELNKFCSL